MNELDFIRKCADGDKHCREQFIRDYSRLIYCYIIRVMRDCGDPFAKQHSNDIFQELVCRLFEDNAKKLRAFEGRNGCSVASWLRQVVINFTTDYVRRIKPALSLETAGDSDDGLLGVLVDNADGAFDRLSAGETMEGLKDCVEALGKDDKYFLEMHINRGVRLDDMREHLGISRSAVDVYKSRLLSRLRDCFKRKGFLAR